MTVEKQSILARAEKNIPIAPYTVAVATISRVENGEYAWMVYAAATDRTFPISKQLSPEGFAPKVGWQVRMISSGSEICGVDIRGGYEDEWHELFYLDEGTRKERLDDMRAALDGESARASEAEREVLERRVAALPEAYQRRIARLRDNNDSFDRDYLEYELFGLEEALKIAAALSEELPDNRTSEQVAQAMMEFYEKPIAIQSARYGVSDAHTPDTFGFAVSIAGADLAGNEDFLVVQHGAMAAKVGCIAYGCHTQEDMDRAKAAGSPTEEVNTP